MQIFFFFFENLPGAFSFFQGEDKKPLSFASQRQLFRVTERPNSTAQEAKEVKEHSERKSKRF